MTLLRGEAPGEEWADEVWMPWRPGQRSKADNTMPQPPPLEREPHGEAEGEHASAGQPVEELLLAGLTHSL